MSGILLVDDERLILETMADILAVEGLGPVYTESDPTAVEDRIREKAPGVMLLDLTLPGRSGFDILESVRSEWPGIQVIVVTGNADAESAVACLKGGAADYLVKAVDRNRLVAAVRRAVQVRDLVRENEALRERIRPSSERTESPYPYFYTRSPEMLEAIGYVEMIAGSSRPLLIIGGTGTGKELMARIGHEAGGRKGPLVAVNVSGYDDAMFSDALFGHVKGAYTGAHDARKGLIEQAAGGTLFLDEIGDLSEASQVKLLRLLDSGEYRPVGGDAVKASRAAVIAATNRDLDGADSSFRKDLYFRLSSHVVRLPDLAERRDDIPGLVRRFAAEAAGDFGVETPEFEPNAMAALVAGDYPGNVRELRAIIADLVGRCRRRTIVSADLEGCSVRRNDPKRPDSGFIIWPDELPTIREAGEALVSEAMSRSGGNQSAAARLLGISQPALNKRIRKRSETVQ